MKEIAIAVISLVVGAILGPYINWGIEKRKQKLAYQRELITKWRAMVEDIASRQLEKNEPLIRLLELNANYFSLKPHLSELTIKMIGADDSDFAKASEWHMRYEQRHPEHERQVAHTTRAFRSLVDEIGRIEKSWDLV
jgi:hypothetical protein